MRMDRSNFLEKKNCCCGSGNYWFYHFYRRGAAAGEDTEDRISRNRSGEFERAINVKNAKALGLTISAIVIMAAD
jgi:hypothetical protein